jgi:shikimate dehydrogenase
MPHPWDLAPGQRFLTGLVGSPIKHSASPAMHEAAAHALGLHCHYQLIEIADADAATLRLLLEGIRHLGFAGVNITFPYKEAVVPLLDALSPAAAAMGAVNTVVVRNGVLTGHNTDATGFARACGPLVEASRRAPVALVGAGGVGKAVGFALAEQGVTDIRVFDTDAAKAETLVAALASRGQPRAVRSVAEALEGAAGLVNGTPVGMLPDTRSPVPEALLHEGLWVADAVYTPLWTPLLLAARRQGARTMTGQDLAVLQACDAFQLFTGYAPAPEVMTAAFDRIMQQRETKPRAA